MHGRFQRFIIDNNLISSDQSVLVALSGGPDSVALLHLLAKLRRSMPLSLSAVYIDHGIRKRAARKEGEFCRNLCRRLKVSFYKVAADIPRLSKQCGKGIEETARDFRYRTFESMRRDHGFDRVAVGHHADDQAETVLFRVIRGTGRTGLSGIPLQRDYIIRPLLPFSRAQVCEYLDKNNLDFCTDLSNKDLKIKRNYIRHKLLPLIRKNLNPAINSALTNLAETAGEEELFLGELTRGAFAKATSMTPGGKIELDLKVYFGYDLWLRRRLLRLCLVELSANGESPDRAVIERLIEFVTTSRSSISLADDIQVTRAGRGLVLHRRCRLKFDEVFDVGQGVPIENSALYLASQVLASVPGKIRTERQARIVYLDHSSLTPPYRIRSIRPGDRFRPLGMRGSKKVGDFLTDRKVAPVFRDEIPVVCDNEGIIWLVGYEIADRARITKKTTEVLKIGCHRRKDQGGATL